MEESSFNLKRLGNIFSLFPVSESKISLLYVPPVLGNLKHKSGHSLPPFLPSSLPNGHMYFMALNVYQILLSVWFVLIWSQQPPQNTEWLLCLGILLIKCMVLNFIQLYIIGLVPVQTCLYMTW